VAQKSLSSSSVLKVGMSLNFLFLYISGFNYTYICSLFCLSKKSEQRKGPCQVHYKLPVHIMRYSVSTWVKPVGHIALLK